MNVDVKCMFNQLILKMEGCIANDAKVVVELPKDIDKSKEGSSAFEAKSLLSKGSGENMGNYGEDFFKITGKADSSVHALMDQIFLAGC